MKSNYLKLSFLLIISLFTAACGSDNLEIYPIRFGQADYTVRLGVCTSVSFVDGGGVYELSASDPGVLGKFYIDNDSRTLVVIPSAVGESMLTITDVATDTSVTLRFVVEDFYLSFIIDQIDGNNINPYLEKGDEIRFIRDGENTKPIKIMRQNNLTHVVECIADGCFDIKRSSTNVFTLDMALHYRHGEELEGFGYTLGGDAMCLDVFNHYFGYGWDESIVSRSQPIRQLKMIMTDSLNSCVISCILQPF